MPRQRSRSPLSPILATESATVRLFFILSVLLCSVNKAGLKTETWLLYCLRLRSRSPHNAKHSTSYIYICMYVCMDRISTIRECYVIYCLWVRSVDGTGYLYLRGYSPASLTNLSQETYYNNVATTTLQRKISC